MWWGGKNDVVASQHGFGQYCDVKFEPDPGLALRPMWAGDQEQRWRKDPGSDSYYSFFVGRLGEAGEPCFDRDWALVNGAIEKIHDWGRHPSKGSGDEAAPLCVYLPLTYPHPPYGVEDPWFSMIDRRALPKRVLAPGAEARGAMKPSILEGIRKRQGLGGWDEARWTELRATYYAMCARVDHQLGLVVEALREAGMYDDSAILVFSDHGDFTGDHGLVEKTQNTFEDPLTRVPLVVKPPQGVKVAPRVSDALVELVDVPATIEELAGVDPGHRHFGRSLIPLISGEAKLHRDAVFCEGGRLAGEVEAMELESAQDPSRLYWPRLSLQSGSGPEHTKAAMCRTSEHKYVHRLYEKDELYDLSTDPGETDNVIEEDRYQEVLSALRSRLLRWYVETTDVVPKVADRR